jgi:hypothetical protein
LACEQPKPLHSSAGAILAGEPLADYSASNYTIAVVRVEHFIAEDIVRGNWDEEMAEIYCRMASDT